MLCAVNHFVTNVTFLTHLVVGLKADNTGIGGVQLIFTLIILQTEPHSSMQKAFNNPNKAQIIVLLSVLFLSNAPSSRFIQALINVALHCSVSQGGYD